MMPPPTTRIIIKNLPKDLDEKGLKTHLSSINCSITDLKLIRTSQGVSRRFAFVGFENTEDTSKVIHHFNNTFIGTLKITIEPVSGNIFRSAPTTKVIFTDHERLKKRATLLSLFSKEDENDPELRSFLAAMKSRSRGQTWTNDDDNAGENINSAQSSLIISTSNADGSDDEYEDWPFSQKTRKLEDSKLMTNKDDGLATINEEQSKLPPDLIQVQKDSILDSGRLFLRSLSYNCKSNDLETFFSPYGPMSEVTLPLTLDSHRSKGFGFVQFHRPEHAFAAFNSLNGTIFQGRRLWIGPATEKNSPTSDSISSFKKIKIAKEKEAAIKETGPSQRLSSLFLSPDAVMEAISAHLGIPKRALLTDPDAAAKMAIAETFIIEQTKSFMLQHGISNYGQTKERSKKIILIKNIPYVDEEGIRAFIDGIGGAVTSGLVRLLVPPTQSIAIGEWGNEESALAAFKALSYRRFKSAPLYVEWAPFQVLSEPLKSHLGSVASQADSTVFDNADQSPKKKEPISSPLESMSTTTSLFVKNLSFYTTSESLLKAVKSLSFQSVDDITSARVCMRKDPKKGMLSCGYGFISFASNSAALKALSFLKEEPPTLDGHRLQVQLAMNDEAPVHEDGENNSRTKENSGSTLLVKNLAFEATSSELRKIFMPFGQVKRIRLPRKVSISSSSPGSHRGFAFVEFVTRADAEAALLALRHTHLYGRHLVLQWAEDDTESIERRLRLSLQNQASSFFSGSKKSSKLAENNDSENDDDDDEDDDY